MPKKTEIRCFKRWTLFKLKDKSIEAEKVLAKDNTLNLNNQWTQKEDEVLGQQVKIHGQ